MANNITRRDALRVLSGGLAGLTGLSSLLVGCAATDAPKTSESSKVEFCSPYFFGNTKYKLGFLFDKRIIESKDKRFTFTEDIYIPTQEEMGMLLSIRSKKKPFNESYILLGNKKELKSIYDKIDPLNFLGLKFGYSGSPPEYYRKVNGKMVELICSTPVEKGKWEILVADGPGKFRSLR